MAVTYQHNANRRQISLQGSDLRFNDVLECGCKVFLDDTRILCTLHARQLRENPPSASTVEERISFTIALVPNQSETPEATANTSGNGQPAATTS